MEIYSGTWWYELVINIVAIFFLIGLGALLPLIRKREEEYGIAFDKKQWSIMISATIFAVVVMVWLGGTYLTAKVALIVAVAAFSILFIWLIGHRKPATLNTKK